MQFSPEPVNFDEKKHVYTTSDGTRLTSVTGFLRKFQLPFDRDGISASVAKKQGRTQEEVLAEWDEKAREGREHGTRIHAEIEQLINWHIHKNRPKNEGGPAWAVAVLHEIPALKIEGAKIYPEVICAFPDFNLAGTADLVVVVGGKFLVYDFKTDKTIDYAGYDNKTMLGPVSHLQDCNFEKYTLQIMVYKTLIEYATGHNLEFAGGAIIHIDKAFNVEKIKLDTARINHLSEEVFTEMLHWQPEDALPDAPLSLNAQPVLNSKSKAYRSQLVEQMVQPYLDGDKPALEGYMLADLHEKLMKEIKEALRDAATEEAEKYAQGERSLQGVGFDTRTTTSYDFSNDDAWLNLNEEEQRVKAGKKEREKLLKQLLDGKQQLADPETGELLQAPKAKKATNTIVFKYPE